MIFELGKAMALISSARFPSGGGRDVPAEMAGAGEGDTPAAGNATSASMASLRSTGPAGNLHARRMSGQRSVDCGPESLPGRFKGIVVTILSPRFGSGPAPQF